MDRTQDNATRKALLVGVHYARTEHTLACIDQNLKAMEEVLSCHQDQNANFACKVLSENVTRPVLRGSIRELFKSDAQVALLYFCGHGAQDLFSAFMVTQDWVPDDFGVSFADLMTMANNSRIPEIVIILDCCYSGNIGEDFSNGNLKGLTMSQLRTGVTLLASSGQEQKSSSDSYASYFTEAVHLALTGLGANLDGEITVADLYKIACEHLITMDGVAQKPTFKASLEKETIIRRVNPKLSPDLLERFPVLFPTPRHEFPLTPQHEPKKDSLPPGADTTVNHELEKEFEYLKRLRDAGLVQADEHNKELYFAAVNSGHCKLTPLGRHYLKVRLSKAAHEMAPVIDEALG